MIKKFLINSLVIAFAGVFSSTSDASLVLVIDDGSTTGIDIVVIDNQPAGSTSSGGAWVSTMADSNMVVGGVVFNGSINSWDINVSTGISKPLVTNNQIDLNSIVASFDPAGAGWLHMMVLDTDFVDNGYGFRTQIGGTTSNEIAAASLVSPTNGDSEADFFPNVVSGSPLFDDTPFSWVEDASASVGNLFGMAVQATVRSTGSGMTSFDLNFQQVPEPTTVLIWSMLAGVGLVVRRRR